MNGLKIILKPLVIICTFVFPIILFFMLLRLANNNTAFFGLNDFVAWIEKQDFYNPIEKFIDFVTSHNEAMKNSLASIYTVGNIFEFFGSVFRILGIAVGYISYPVVFIYHLIAMFINYIVMFYNLIKYVVELRMPV